MTFSDRLKELRTYSNLTQKELASRCGVAQSCIAMLEKGRSEANVATLLALSRVFNVSTDYLLGLEDELGGRVSSSSSPMAAGVTYSDKEMDLIEAFRKLMPETQDFILRTAQSLNERDKKGAK